MVSRFILEILRKEIRAHDTPDLLLVNRDDVELLLDLIDVAEKMVILLKFYHPQKVRLSKEFVEDWEHLLHHEV